MEAVIIWFHQVIHELAEVFLLLVRPIGNVADFEGVEDLTWDTRNTHLDSGYLIAPVADDVPVRVCEERPQIRKLGAFSVVVGDHTSISDGDIPILNVAFVVPVAPLVVVDGGEQLGLGVLGPEVPVIHRPPVVVDGRLWQGVIPLVEVGVCVVRDIPLLGLDVVLDGLDGLVNHDVPEVVEFVCEMDHTDGSCCASKSRLNWQK